MDFVTSNFNLAVLSGLILFGVGVYVSIEIFIEEELSNYNSDQFFNSCVSVSWVMAGLILMIHGQALSPMLQLGIFLLVANVVYFGLVSRSTKLNIR